MAPLELGLKGLKEGEISTAPLCLFGLEIFLKHFYVKVDHDLDIDKRYKIIQLKSTDSSLTSSQIVCVCLVVSKGMWR